jgi:hypothetical protein
MSSKALWLGWLPPPNTAEIAPDTPAAINSGMRMITPIAATPTFAIIACPLANR